MDKVVNLDADVKEYIEKQSKSLNVSEEKVIDICLNSYRNMMQAARETLKLNEDLVDKTIADVIKDQTISVEKLNAAELEKHIKKQAEAYNMKPVRYINNCLKNYIEITRELTEQIGSNIKNAEKLINQMEKEQTLFGNDERNFIVNYSFQGHLKEDVKKLAEHIALEGYEINKGYCDPLMKDSPEEYVDKILKNDKEKSLDSVINKANDSIKKSQNERHIPKEVER